MGINNGSKSLDPHPWPAKRVTPRSSPPLHCSLTPIHPPHRPSSFGHSTSCTSCSGLYHPPRLHIHRRDQGGPFRTATRVTPAASLNSYKPAPCRHPRASRRPPALSRVASPSPPSPSPFSSAQAGHYHPPCPSPSNGPLFPRKRPAARPRSGAYRSKQGRKGARTRRGNAGRPRSARWT